MPVLSIPNSFIPFTKILSADVSANFTAITTLLNTTGLDDTNVQVVGLTRNGASSRLKAGTANYVLINDSSGFMSEEVTLSTVRGGLGVALTPTGSDALKVIAVNAGGTAFQLTTNSTPSSLVYSYYQFT